LVLISPKDGESYQIPKSLHDELRRLRKGEPPQQLEVDHFKKSNATGAASFARSTADHRPIKI